MIAVLAMLFRISRDVGELKGEVKGINARIDETNRRIDETNRRIEGRQERAHRPDRCPQHELDWTDWRCEHEPDGGELKAVSTSLTGRIDSLVHRIDSLERRIENLEQSVATLREQLARETGYIRGSLDALNERVDLVMRHRHDEFTGEVTLTPEQVAAD